MSDVLVTHSYTYCKGTLSVLTATVLINWHFVVSFKGQTQIIFSFHPCSVFLCYSEMDAFMFSVFSIPFVGLEAY